MSGLIKSTQIYKNARASLNDAHERYLHNINNMGNGMLTIIILAQAIKLYLFYYVFYRYMKHLETDECKCAVNYPYFKTLKYFFIVICFATLYTMLLNIVRFFNIDITTHRLIYVIQMAVSLAGIFGLLFVLHFLNNIDDCECSESKEKRVMFWYSATVLGVLAFITLMPILTIIVANTLSFIY